MASKVLRSKETGKYLSGWDVFGKPKYHENKSLANRMNYPTASKVAGTLATTFDAGEFDILPADE